MDNEIQLISDGDGVAVIGDPAAVERFLVSEGLSSKAPRSLLPNPALLAGAAGIMAQVAMQQTMNEITDYLATIDEKLDDVLRAQEDVVWADVIGVGFDIEEAMTIRGYGGRVNEVTWSKVQATSATSARTQAYALRQLDVLAERWSVRLGSVISPRRPRKPSPRPRVDPLFWLVASNCRTRSPCLNSTE